jgi:hypothetical protein
VTFRTGELCVHLKHESENKFAECSELKPISNSTVERICDSKTIDSSHDRVRLGT